jgi:hypothetical protein
MLRERIMLYLFESAAKTVSHLRARTALGSLAISLLEETGLSKLKSIRSPQQCSLDGRSRAP